MRFLVMAISEEGASGAEAVATMTAYHQSLQKAGVLLARDRLFPPDTGARISFTDGKPMVTDGPFARSNEVIGGYWILQVRSREEAIEWARRAPMCHSDVIEVRRIHEMSDSEPNV